MKILDRYALWVLKFMQKYQLFPRKGGRAYLAVSGGRDSMTLLFLFNYLRQKGEFPSFKVLHLNHGSRGEENDREEELVRSICQQFSIECITAKWNLSVKRNFEQQARLARHLFFKEEASGEQDLIYFAHHIDDSFEWSLLQQLKTSDLKKQIGIPTKIGKFRRPFMCLSRQQIANLSEKMKWPYLEDSSNQSSEFERNFLRKHIAEIKLRFPSYLKLYIERARRMLEMREILLSTVLKEGGNYSLALDLQDFSLTRDQLRKIIMRLSMAERGKLYEQLNKLVTMIEHGKQGPLFFSGGVKVYFFPGLLFFSGPNYQKKSVQSQQQEICAQELWDKLQIQGLRPEQALVSWDKNRYPGLPCEKKINPLASDLSIQLLQEGKGFSSIMRLIRYQFKKKKEKEPLTLCHYLD